MDNLHQKPGSRPIESAGAGLQGAQQAQKTSPLDFSALRILAQGAYNLAMEKVAGNLAAADCSAQIGELFYPQNLPGDQRRLGGMIGLSILSLDAKFRKKEILGGPALHEDTRRLLVADVIASAHLQVKDLGFLHKKIEEWYPVESVEETFSEETLRSAIPDKTQPALKPGQLFNLERVLGCKVGDPLRASYAVLQVTVFGAMWLLDGADEGVGSHALQVALHNFTTALDPILKGEVTVKGEG